MCSCDCVPPERGRLCWKCWSRLPNSGNSLKESINQSRGSRPATTRREFQQKPFFVSRKSTFWYSLLGDKYFDSCSKSTENGRETVYNCRSVLNLLGLNICLALPHKLDLLSRLPKSAFFNFIGRTKFVNTPLISSHSDFIAMIQY